MLGQLNLLVSLLVFLDQISTGLCSSLDIQAKSNGTSALQEQQMFQVVTSASQFTPLPVEYYPVSEPEDEREEENELEELTEKEYVQYLLGPLARSSVELQPEISESKDATQFGPRCLNAYNECVARCGSAEKTDFDCSERGLSISQACSCADGPNAAAVSRASTSTSGTSDASSPLVSEAASQVSSSASLTPVEDICPLSQCIGSQAQCCTQFEVDQESLCRQFIRDFSFGGLCDIDGDGQATRIVVKPVSFGSDCYCANDIFENSKVIASSEPVQLESATQPVEETVFSELSPECQDAYSQCVNTCETPDNMNFDCSDNGNAISQACTCKDAATASSSSVASSSNLPSVALDASEFVPNPSMTVNQSAATGLSPSCQIAYSECLSSCMTPENMNFNCSDKGNAISQACSCIDDAIASSSSSSSVASSSNLPSTPVPSPSITQNQSSPVTVTEPARSFVTSLLDDVISDPQLVPQTAPVQSSQTEASACPLAVCFGSASSCCSKLANDQASICSDQLGISSYQFGGYCDVDGDGEATNVVVQRARFGFDCYCPEQQSQAVSQSTTCESAYDQCVATCGSPESTNFDCDESGSTLAQSCTCQDGGSASSTAVSTSSGSSSPSFSQSTAVTAPGSAQSSNRQTQTFISANCQSGYDMCVITCGSADNTNFDCDESGSTLAQSCSCLDAGSAASTAVATSRGDGDSSPSTSIAITTPDTSLADVSSQIATVFAPSTNSCPLIRCIGWTASCCGQFELNKDGICTAGFMSFSFGGYCDKDGDGIATDIVVEPNTFGIECYCE
eukprot:TRINITY_DN3637_c0_g4_i1.p1 TRINITY_DN3637_c0_g4~~TRINITY_DN3637_c0_g4_i1.p1  ORF type:complete len:799 (+),score=51.04 TRINITY_DN3637_c0_g4_i1:160-2556(+)